MAHPFGSINGDFYVNMRLGSQMPLPQERETVLHFFERVRKVFPAMTGFRRLDGGELTLEEDRSGETYRWMTLEQKRLYAGHVNPSSLEEGMRLHTLLLDAAPHFLGLSTMEIDHLDVLLGFDLEYNGNHDEIIAETMYADSPLACLGDVEGARPVDFQPVITVAFGDDCRQQARIEIVTRTGAYQVRSGDYSDDAISVYLIMRQYWGDPRLVEPARIAAELVLRGEQLLVERVIPRIVQPISAAIATRS